MRYVNLDALDVRLSCLGLGGEQLGGHSWGNVSEKEMVQAVHRAVEKGVTLFDTAPVYGLGHSEEVLGKLLGAARKNVIIATKVGLVWKKAKQFEKSTDCSPATIEREVDASLKRLGTDYIDIYQIHWPDPDTPIEETLLAMNKLRQAGKIRCIGLCNFSLELLKEAVKYGEIGTVQIPYNLIDRKHESDVLPFCHDHKIAIFAYSPIARGFLSGKYDKDATFGADDRRSSRDDEYFRGATFMRNQGIIKKLEIIADKYNKTPSQIALRWVLGNPHITAAIFGAKNVSQVEENIAAADFTLSQEDIEFLNQVE